MPFVAAAILQKLELLEGLEWLGSLSSSEITDLATRAEQAYGEFAAQGAKAVAARRGTTQVTTKSASKPAAKRASKPAATSPEPAVAAGAVAGPTGTTESNLNGSGQTA